MRYGRAVQKLSILADACQHTTNWPTEGPFLLEAYVFGDVLEGVDQVDQLEVAFVLDVPCEEVRWESRPDGGLVDPRSPAGQGRFRLLVAFPARSRVEPPHSRPGPVLVGRRC